jgi:hypothetical protein
MKRVAFVIGLSFAAAAQDKPQAYHIKGMQIEGCECDLYCPCVFQKDATFDQCRGYIGWKISEGKYASTDLKGIEFCVALTKLGKNIEKEMGKWEGILYISDMSTGGARQSPASTARSRETGTEASIARSIDPRRFPAFRS